MNVFIQLLDLETGNVLTEYDTEQDALRELGVLWRTHGHAALDHLALLRFRDGAPTLIAMERDLVDRVLAEFPGTNAARGVADRTGNKQVLPRILRFDDGAASESLYQPTPS